MQLTTLVESRNQGVNWLIDQVRGSQPLKTQPATRETAMAEAYEWAATRGGPSERYIKINYNVGLKRIGFSKEGGVMFRAIKEANCQVMARNRLARFGIKVPVFYGFIHAKREDGEWCVYAVMEHINGKTLNDAGLETIFDTHYGTIRDQLEHVCREADAAHHDLHANNAMVSHGKIVVIDWEFCHTNKANQRARFERIARGTKAA